ncbi:hypothetical protein MITS9509_02492 [Synechococcus sp. MIT S9509]|nr:hypothetical protein MITS9509_02492 [Synechococcus sp. MIT S9509]
MEEPTQEQQTSNLKRELREVVLKAVPASTDADWELPIYDTKYRKPPQIG